MTQNRLTIRRTLSSLELLCLRCSANTTRETPERNNTLVVQHGFEVRICFCEFQACITVYLAIIIGMFSPGFTSQSSRYFTHVLEVRTEVLAAGAGR